MPAFVRRRVQYPITQVMPRSTVFHRTGHTAEYCISSHGSCRGVLYSIARVIPRGAAFHYAGHAAECCFTSHGSCGKNPRGFCFESAGIIIIIFSDIAWTCSKWSRSLHSGSRSFYRETDHIIPGAPAGIGGMGSLMLATAASVVRKLEATLVAF